MSVKLEGRKKPYHPKDSDTVECPTHGVEVLWGDLSPIAKLSVEEGLDTVEDCECLLLSKV